MKNACRCVCSVHEQRAGADQLHAERTVAGGAEHGEPTGDEGRDRQLLRWTHPRDVVWHTRLHRAS